MRPYGYLALLSLLLSEILLFLGNPFLGRWFYLASWWSYILILDALVAKRRGSSLVFSRELPFMAFWSVTFWLIFEWFNLFLKNWHYVNVTSSLALRYLGYFLSFATVLPGVLLTFEALNLLLSPDFGGVKPLKRAELLLIPLFTLGFVTFILPVIYPKYTFPLVWGAVVFILEPLNYIMDEGSILREWERGSLRTFLLLLLSGLICGFLWEFWNYWAYTKWVYTVPFVGKPKLFEMPILGYLGFPPFAVECWCFYRFVKKLFFRSPLDLLSLPIQFPFHILIFSLIDHHTVFTFLGS